MTIAEVINNQYGEGSVDKVLQKCKDLHMTLDGIKETSNMLSCMIEQPDKWFKNDFDKDLAQAIDNTCILFSCHPDFKDKEMCTKYN